MKRMIIASMEKNQYSGTLLEQNAKTLFTADEIVDLLNTIEELKGLKVYYSIELRGNVTFTVGNCEYVMAGDVKS